MGQRYSDLWHRLHLTNPRAVVPESNMPGFPWLAQNKINEQYTAKKMQVLRQLGVPYSDEDITSAVEQVLNKTELDALVAYLQSLGHALK